MKLTFIIITALIIVAITLLFVFGKYSQKGQAAGLVNASLTRCTTKPNCVCSEHIDDSEHYIEPVTHIQHADIKNMSKAISIIKQMNGTLQSVKKNYIAASFSSSIFGFVDDFEIRVDPQQRLIHLRSASRVGYGDGGVNRKRVEVFKSLYQQDSDK